MKILLVSANLALEPYAVFPLGLGVVARALRQNGHEVRLFDPLTAADPHAELARLIAAFAPRLVGLGIRNLDNVNSLAPRSYFDDAVRLTAVVRRATAAPIFLGGAGFSLLPEELLDLTGADGGIVGSGETAVVELARIAENGIPPESRLLRARDLPEEFGGADYDEEIAAFHLRETGILPLQTKRGCPHHCVYCSYPLLEGRVCRSRPHDEVAEELAELQRRFAPELFYFTDSIFNDPAGNWRELLETIIRRRVDVAWSAFFTPEAFSNDDVTLMRRAGLRTAELGADAMSDAALAGLGKNYDFATVEKSCAALLRQNLQVSSSYIAGGPGETPSTLREGIANLRRLDRVPAFVFQGIRILPDTVIAAIARREGLLAPGQSLLEPLFYLAPAVADTIEAILTDGFRDLRHVVYPPQARTEELRLYRKLRAAAAEREQT